MPTTEEVVRAYIKLRDEKKDIQDRHKEELAPFNDKLKKLEAWLLREMQQQGADSIKTPGGTAYQSTIVKPVVNDWDVLLQHVQDEGLWAMLERRVSKTAVEEYMESTGTAPPGVSISQETFARIRR